VRRLSQTRLHGFFRDWPSANLKLDELAAKQVKAFGSPGSTVAPVSIRSRVSLG
jgi:hypothetical protein